MRDAVREVLRIQADDKPWGSAQIRLRLAYASFVRSFGPINLTTISETVNAEGETRETFRRPNLQPFLDDPDVWLVASIEDYDLESGTAKQGPIFRERVLHPETTPLIETAEDALAVTLHETGAVDLDRIAELLGRSGETAIAELGERIYLDPEATHAYGRDVWVTADAYLSGKIRDKLTAAKAAAGLNERYRRNVAALEKTLPEDLKPSDITARLGAPWIPAGVVAAFSEGVLGVATPVYHTVAIARRRLGVRPQQPVERLRPRPELRPRLDLAVIGKRRLPRPQDPSHRIARQMRAPRDLLDRLPLAQMLPPYPSDRLHNQHPPPSASRQSRQTIKPRIGGSILDADDAPQGVNFARRNTAKPAWFNDNPILSLSKDDAGSGAFVRAGASFDNLRTRGRRGRQML